MYYTVAIADDEEMMRRGLTRMIPWNELGYEVVAVEDSGRALIDYLEKNDVDVVLTDVSMDDLTGIDVARFVHENRPDTVTVVISGFGDFSYAQQAVEYGVFKYLLKPVSPDEMSGMLEELKDEIARRRHISRMETRYESIRRRLTDQFVMRAARGMLRDMSQVERSVQSQEIDAGFLERRCMMCSFILAFSRPCEVPEDELFSRFFSGLDLALTAHVIYAEGGWIRALLTEEAPGALPGNVEDNAFAQTLARKMYRRQSVSSAWVCPEKLYDSVRTLCQTGFEAWNLPVIATKKDTGATYCSTTARHGVLQALRAGDRDEMRVSLMNYFRACAEPMQGIWHARFMARVLLWQIAQIVDDGGESYIFMPDEYAIVRATGPEQLTDLVMDTYDKMIVKREKSQRAQDSVEQAKAYIQSHHAEDISLITLSEKLYMAPAYFSRLFHERTGTTYIDYLNAVRLTAAAKMLGESSVPMADIAEKVGFRDQRYFARRFKQRFGCTPSEYRERGGK